MRNENFLRQYSESIKRCELFRGISDGDLATILRFSHFRQVPKDYVLAWQDEACPAIYCVAAGSIIVKHTTQPNQTTVLGYVQNGETIGEAFIFCEAGSPAALTTGEESMLLVIEAAPFQRYIQQHPKLAMRVMANISRQLSSMVAYVARLKTYNAEQRVASYILQHDSQEMFPYAMNGLAHRRRDLAELLGIKPETLSRVISRFKNSGWITADHGVFDVIDREQLTAVLG